jgi:hypothetical protein
MDIEAFEMDEYVASIQRDTPDQIAHYERCEMAAFEEKVREDYADAMGDNMHHHEAIAFVADRNDISRDEVGSIVLAGILR